MTVKRFRYRNKDFCYKYATPSGVEDKKRLIFAINMRPLAGSKIKTINLAIDMRPLAGSKIKTIDFCYKYATSNGVEDKNN
jgi:hypothetical protein